MGLKIYESPTPTSAFSTDGEFLNPISITVDGIVGAVILRRYYVRNDEPLLYFTNIQVTPVIISGLDIVTGATSGFVWRLIAGDTQPLEDQWSITPSGNIISLPNIGAPLNGNTTTYLPFWLRIEVPRGTDVQSFENVNLQIEATAASV